MSHASLTASALLAVVVAAACAPDPMGTPIDGSPTDAGTGVSPDAGPCVPGPRPIPMDPRSLPACCSSGAAHCVATSNVDPGFASHLATCPTGVCVPDPFIADPGFAPRACKSIGDAAGVCVSACIPEVAKYGTILPIDVCEGGDRCAPCVSPLDDASTGSCDLGKPSAAPACGTPAPEAGPGGAPGDAGPSCPYVGPPIIEPTTLAACGTVTGAHCLGEKLVPAKETPLLARCPGGYCVPDTFIASGGNFLPSSCRAAGDIEGRCLHESLPDVGQKASSLVRSTCTPQELCVPCFDPLTGKDTGACYLGCDIGPHEPATLYPSCCSRPAAPAPLGTCIPAELVPSAQQTNLDADTCAAGKAFCVPHEQLVSTVPVKCTATASIGKEYAGVCLSTCLKFDFLSSLGMATGTCDNLHVCAPCTNPITGQPTGAPGCGP
jgi:hypothetical protein